MRTDLFDYQLPEELIAQRPAEKRDCSRMLVLDRVSGKCEIREFADIFHLDKYKDKITNMEGFGEKSYQNIIASTEKAKDTTLSRFLYANPITRKAWSAIWSLACKI